MNVEIEHLNNKSQSSGARTQGLLEEYAMLISNTTMEGASATTSTPSKHCFRLNVAEVDV